MPAIHDTIATEPSEFSLGYSSDDMDDQSQIELPVEEPKEPRFYLHDGIVRELAATMDEWAYYEMESRNRGISIVEMYDIEDEARRAIEMMGVTEQFLADAARRSRPAPQYLANDQTRPF
jgi:hypothetical protein